MENLLSDAPNTNDGATPDETVPEVRTDGTTETPAEVKPEETAPQGAPEKYEFSTPEGKTYDTGMLTSFEEAAREANLPQDAAQKMLDKLAPVVDQRIQAQVETIRNEWAESAKTDKEFGGDKLAENLSIAKAALDKFGSPELKQLISNTGLGSNPEIIRLLYRAGKELQPDTFVGGHKPDAAKPSGAKSFGDMADALYS